uniref:Uncharacterized protein n=1 Tax=Timema monikensis TaxID=170555 RepID=A0A7R9HV59_9NEOP|nr:unnamed protein product [Timema monikensis]
MLKSALTPHSLVVSPLRYLFLNNTTVSSQKKSKQPSFLATLEGKEIHLKCVNLTKLCVFNCIPLNYQYSSYNN